MSGTSSAPDWIRAALRGALADARLYLFTALGFTFHPVRFTREWAAGEREALNPFGVLATGAGLIAAAEHLISYLRTAANAASDSLAEDVLNAIAPFAYYAVLGAICHALLKLARSRRSLSDSLAIALFAGGGPAVAMLLVSYLAAIGAWLASGHAPIGEGGLMGAIPQGPLKAMVALLAAGSFAAFLVCFSAGMSALHEVRGWATTAALVVALALAGLALGKWNVAHVGTHPLIQRVQRAGETSPHWKVDLWID